MKFVGLVFILQSLRAWSATKTSHQSKDVVGTKSRRLLVDVSVFCRGDAGSGIQRVVRNVVRQLARLDRSGLDICFIAAVDGYGGYRQLDENWLGAGSSQGLPPGSALRAVSVARGDYFLGLDLAPRIVGSRWLQLLRWRWRGVRLWFVLYDILPAQQPQWFAPASVRHFQRWLDTVALVAEGTICISRSAKNGFDHWLCTQWALSQGAVASVVVPLGTGLDEPISGRSEGHEVFLPATLESVEFVLMVGTIEPRKAHAEVLDAFEQLWAAGEPCALVIAGKPGWMVDPLLARINQHPEAGKRLFWLNRPSDAVLHSLYTGCKGLLMASQGEGFGLPVVEALQHGKPVLARDLPIFHEISGDCGMSYFASRPDALRLALQQWLAAMAAGTVSDFTPPPGVSWSDTCQQMLQAMGLSARPGPGA